MSSEARMPKAEEIRSESKAEGVSIRALVIGSLWLLFLAYFVPRAGMGQLFPGIDVEGAPQAAGLGLVFLLLIANIVLKRFGINFTRAEMILVYIMSMLGGLIVGRGAVFFVPLSLMSLPMLTLRNAAVYKEYFDGLSPIIIPKDMTVIRGFWFGNTAVPWGHWILPLLVWSAFLTVIFWVMLCILTVVRKHWVEHERLLFPLTTPVFQMVEGKVAEGVPFWRNRLVYIGMIYPLIFHGLAHINNYFPSVPRINAITLFPDYHFSQHTYFYPDPVHIGIGYLLPLDLLFSMWFFFWVRIAGYGYYIRIGVYDNNYFWLFRSHGFGGFLMLALVALWTSRNELKIMIAKAFGRKVDYDDSDEPLPYAVAFWGSIIGIVLIMTFCWGFLKINVWFALAYFLIFFACALTFSRIRAEAGWPYTHPMPEQTPDVFNKTLGGTVLRDNAMGYGLLHTLCYGYFAATGAIAMEAYRFGDLVGIRRRTLTKIMIAIVFLITLIGFASAVTMFYDLGANTTHPFYIQQGSGGFDWYLGSSVTANYNKVWGTIRGAVIAGILSFLRMRFVWWPLHPLGWVTGNIEFMTVFWSGFLIAWIIKFIVSRYGGQKMSRELVPLFLGMIAGSVIISLIGSVVGLIVQFVS